MSVNVFYAEDEPSLAKIVSESLISRGFDVTLAIDGKEALESFDKDKFDIAILDIMMPKIDGFHVAQKILSLEPNLPIIFLTAKTQTKDLIKGFEIGARDYIKKPFSMEELIVRINNLLRTSTSTTHTSTEYTLGQFTFRPSRYEILYGERMIQLSERESRILDLLCIHMNEACDRKKILMEIWGDDSFYNSRNLDVYINKLRKLLSIDPELEIVTLKGVGYVFKV